MARATLVSTLQLWQKRVLLIGLALLGLLGSSGCFTPIKQSLQVWIVDERQQLAVNTPPISENAIFSTSQREIRLTAAINETIAFQLGLHTDTPPDGPFTIELSNLSGAGGTLKAGSVASLYHVHSVPVERFRSWYPQHTGQTTISSSRPDILVPWEAPRGGGPVQLEGSGNKIVWVDLRIPPTTDPGLYTGQLTITNLVRRTVPLVYGIRLRVLPVALPSTPALPAICRLDPSDLLTAHLHWPREVAEQTRLLPGTPHHRAALDLVGATVRLFHEHLTNPVLWASFPEYRLVGEREIEVDWEPYDRLVSGWLDGEAFPDQVGLSAWPVPVSINHPSAQLEGDLTSPHYARVLAAYLAECQRHFAERGWLKHAFVRLLPPEKLTTANVKRVEQVAGILRQSETTLPLIAHLPARSLRGLGWRNAPAIDLSDVRIWAPRAMWFEPDAMRQARTLGQQTWLMPDYPPYSSTLSSAGLPTDAQALPWLAYRYDVEALWIEHAAEFGQVTDNWPVERSAATDCLIHPGTPFGLPNRPVPSIRLKRLRRGLQDHTLLSLLKQRGKKLLAQSLAQQVVRWGCTEAGLDNLLCTKQTGWPRDARILTLARELVLDELVNEILPLAEDSSQQISRMAEWAMLMNQATRVRVAVAGIRLHSADEKLRAEIYCSALNYTNRALSGRWLLPNPPLDWESPAQLAMTLPPDTYRLGQLDLNLNTLAYNTEGAYPFELQFDTTTLGAFVVPARLAVAVCPSVDNPPTVDADLSDWPIASNNIASDFLLVRGRQALDPSLPSERPALPTQAFFSMDHEHLYIAIRCRLNKNEPAVWRADNLMPVDGSVPWGQDVVEILIDPRPTAAGTSSDIYCLQIKPNAVLITRQGCLTEPPIGRSVVWQSGATVAVQAQPEVWVVELALPLASLGRGAFDNRIWGFNITRLDSRRGEYSSWSGARGHCYSPQSLGNLILLRP